ncbi:hypothetical protein Bca52824_016878 [Brassica carinata]|uniref:Uncharacterized protein n=1 Tax=Brassica carinata TaxID=52824 RepID=A0A8X8B5W5_BRACI|nr:hypothetical protein Bca52824_016878 [Brassica carinata]
MSELAATSLSKTASIPTDGISWVTEEDAIEEGESYTGELSPKQGKTIEEILKLLDKDLWAFGEKLRTNYEETKNLVLQIIGHKDLHEGYCHRIVKHRLSTQETQTATVPFRLEIPIDAGIKSTAHKVDETFHVWTRMNLYTIKPMVRLTQLAVPKQRPPLKPPYQLQKICPKSIKGVDASVEPLSLGVIHLGSGS